MDGEKGKDVIGYWHRRCDVAYKKFIQSNNIHDFIDWKKHCWLIEGYNAGRNSLEHENKESKESKTIWHF